MSNKHIGDKGEDIATEYLKKIGYKIIVRNKHFSKNCEIDIIAEDKTNTIIFIEVKTRTNNSLGEPTEAITTKKYTNIKKGVFSYLQENTNYKKFRIDAISIILTPKIQIKHFKNI